MATRNMITGRSYPGKTRIGVFAGLVLCLCLLRWSAEAGTVPSSIMSDASTLTLNVNLSEGPLTNATYWTAKSGVTAVEPILQSDPHGPNPAASAFAYYVPSGRQLPLYRAANAYMKPWSSGVVTMGGSALHLAGTYNPRTDYMYAKFRTPDLYLYNDSASYANNAGQGLCDTSIHVQSDIGHEFIVNLYPDSNAIRYFTFERCVFTGTSSCGVKFVQGNPVNSNPPQSSELRLLNCDLSAFYGQIRFANTISSRLAGKVVITGAHSFPGTLSTGDNVMLSLKGSDAALEVGTLSLGHTNAFEFVDVTNSVTPRLTVGNQLTRQGGSKIKVTCTFSAAAPYGTWIPLVKVASGAGAIAEQDFEIASAEIARYKVEEQPDESTVLFVQRPVEMVVTDSAPRALTEAGSNHWANALRVQAGYDYYVPSGKTLALFESDVGKVYTFPGDSLTLAGEMSVNGSPNRFAVQKFRICPPATVLMYNGSDFSFDSPNPISIVSTSGTGTEELIFHSYGSNKGDSFHLGTSVDAEIEGNGILAMRWRGKDVSYGHLAFNGLNTNFIGKVKVFCNRSSDSYYPFGEKFGTLWVADQRNLGGAIPGANTPVFDALTVTDRQILRTKCDVTFDEPTRGIYVPFGARFRVDENQTLTIKQQLTYAGKIEKIGAGTLALGGTARFTADVLQTPYASNTFLEGTNVLAVCEGALKPLSAAAFAGVAVVMSNNTSIVLDPNPSDPAIAQFGINATAAGSSLSVPAGQVTVKLANEPANQHNAYVPVATFATAAEAETFKGKLSFPRQWSGWQTRLEVLTANDGGAARYVVKASCTFGGCTVIIR